MRVLRTCYVLFVRFRASTTKVITLTESRKLPTIKILTTLLLISFIILERHCAENKQVNKVISYKTSHQTTYLLIQIFITLNVSRV